MEAYNFETAIKPFFWVASEKTFSVCLNAGTYKPEIFEWRKNEGFEGNGYDWASLAKVFVEEKRPDLAGDIKFDPEADMFCAYSHNPECLKEFITGFKKTCEDEVQVQDLLLKAEID
ncbi:immunity 51 family protein [uncultured Chryseobacterium sp.]|uniref:immunity 51 family protein n=1 Tax=uncultured Chryseobacterium sp. TaxID=259322 RepID=UPI0025F66C59|nr:immunity 51 family protein [uncultured Chryseobacterium sp.]